MIKPKFYILGILGIILFASGVVISTLVIKQQPQVLGLTTQSELTTLISEVGKLIILPSNESPTITTIGDTSKLNSQSFFKNAKNGDKLLYYANAKWAVLFRPSENKIIEVGTFNTNEQTTPAPSTSPSPSPTPSPTPSPSPSPTESPSASPSSSPSVSPSPKT